jgi:hypothetical protein
MLMIRMRMRQGMRRQVLTFEVRSDGSLLLPSVDVVVVFLFVESPPRVSILLSRVSVPVSLFLKISARSLPFSYSLLLLLRNNSREIRK